MKAYREDCEQLLRCARGDPSALPHCPLGWVNAGGSGQCSELCSDAHPCKRGRCTPWQGTRVCQ
jgi:hypothetical protein